MGNGAERDIWDAGGGCPMDRQWGHATLSFDKKVDRITYGGATVQAMDKNEDFQGFPQRGLGV